MSRNRLVFEGLSELRAALRRLPEDLAGEASHEVEGAANGAAVAVRANYGRHRRTGNLQDHVVVEHVPVGRFAAGAIVKSLSPHAHLFEDGTQTRQTAIGANRGAMPPGHAFRPPVIRARQRMYERLAEMLRRHGLVVSGTDG